jgi:hypothetical protein
MSFFKTINNNTLSKRSTKGNSDIGLEIDIESLEQVALTNTDAKLTIANASTKIENIETQILQIEIDGELQTVLFHHIPENNTAERTTSNRSSSSYFSGSVYTTNLSGMVLSGFKINNGNVLGSFNFFTGSYGTNPTDPICYTCGIQQLDEILITSNTSYTATNPTYTNMDSRGYQWSRSSNNYSSMGIAYAKYYRQKAIKAFFDKIDDDELTGKAKCLNDKLKEKGNSFIKSILDKFKGNSEFDVTLESKNKVYKSNSTIEVNGQTRYTSGNKTIYIDISISKLSTMPALAAARTILHEYIHADIFRKLNTKYTTTGTLDFKKTYEAYESEQHHNSMAELYITSMSDALRSFHETVLIGDYNYLTDNGANPLPDTFYEGLAWQRLKGKNLKAYEDLSLTKKNELKDSLEKHYHSTTKNCPK